MSICDAGQKRFDADVHHQAAFDDGFHLALDQAVAGKNARDLVPVLTISRFLFRKHDHAFVVLEALEQHFHFVANLKRIDVFEFRRGNDALGSCNRCQPAPRAGGFPKSGP